jgi:hypothetical protein
MKATVDDQRRLVLPQAEPGEVFQIESQADGKILLIPVSLAGSHKKPTREEIRRALDNVSAKCDMTWEEIRAMTRDL